MASKIADMFSVPAGFGAVRGRVINNKSVIMSLSVLFVMSFGSMVVSAFCADHIRKSSCGATDEKAKAAYTWSWVSAVMSGIISLAAVGGIGVIMLAKPK